MVEYLHDDYGIPLQECLKRIYHSNMYKKLATENTKYWHLSPVDLYEELIAEGPKPFEHPELLFSHRWHK